MEINERKRRSQNVKRNIIASFLLKIVGVGLSFLLLPLTIHYLTAVEYGIWMTLFSVMSWVNLLDMGIGLGLRNKLAEAIAEDNKEKICSFLSTGIFTMIIMGIFLAIIFLISIQFVDMQSIFNTTLIEESRLYQSTLLTGLFVICTFVLSAIDQIFYAYQKAAFTGCIQVTYNLLMLIFVYLLTYQGDHNITYFVYSFGVASILSKTVFAGWFFYNHKRLIPKFKYICKDNIYEIANMGIKFFIIQLTCIIMFSSSNILITQCLGPEYIRDYDVTFKIFSIVTIAHGIICAPLWTAYTEAYIKRDFDWIKRTIQKLELIIIPIVFLVICLYFLLDWIISMWIGPGIRVEGYLKLFMAIYVVIVCWTNIWTMFLNGIGDITIQMYSNIIGSSLIFFLAVYFMSIFSTAGMILAIDLGLGFTGIILFIQVQYLLKRRL